MLLSSRREELLIKINYACYIYTYKLEGNYNKNVYEITVSVIFTISVILDFMNYRKKLIIFVNDWCYYYYICNDPVINNINEEKSDKMCTEVLCCVFFLSTFNRWQQASTFQIFLESLESLDG